MNIQLIAMDMDGTLLGADHFRIPEGNLAALRQAHERGIRLALCSGRIPDDAGFFALDAGLPMHILGLNGGCCLDRPLGPIVRSAYMPADAARQIIDMLDAAQLEYGVFSDNDLIVSAPSVSERDLQVLWGAHLTRPGARCVIGKGGEGLEAMLQRGVNKIVAFTRTNMELLPPLRRRMEAEIPQVEVSSSWVNNIEINPRGVNKGTALTALAASLSIPMEQVMALGDNDNDVPMLSVAGVGVAMANSTPAALAAADYVTLDNKRCGVAAAIRALALGESIPEVKRLK